VDAAASILHAWVAFDYKFLMRIGRKVFFFEKKTKKLLSFGYGAAPGDVPKSQKFFASFFQKRRP
jgi:hypothetical protein